MFRNVSRMAFAALLLLAMTPAMAQKKAVGNAAGTAASRQGNVQKPAESRSAPQTNSARNGGGGIADNRNNGGGNRTGNTNNVGNKVSIDNSKKNVNINVDNSKDIRVNNSRNTAVRHAPNYRPYIRPPYRYGGRVYFCYHPYFYHPYRPFVWGPMWHPWGFFVATLATTAIIVSIVDNDLPDLPVAVQMDGAYAQSGPYSAMMVNSDGALMEVPLGQDYYYDEGVFYLKMEGGYTVVAGPVGAVVPKLPSGYETAKLDDGSTNYYFGGTFYVKDAKGYKVVAPTAGTVVEHLPDGGEEVQLGDVKYVKLGDIYFQPIQQDGKNVYEIASVEEDK